MFAEILGESLDLLGLGAFVAAHAQGQANHDFFHAILADYAVKMGEIVLFILPVQRVQALGRHAERIGDGNSDTAQAYVESEYAGFGGLHVAIIEGWAFILPRCGPSLRCTADGGCPYSNGQPLLLVLLQRFAVGDYVFVVLFHGAGEAVVPLGVGYEVVVIGLGGVHRGLQGAAARVRNRPRRKPGVAIGVVGGRELHVGVV